MSDRLQTRLSPRELVERAGAVLEDVVVPKFSELLTPRKKQPVVNAPQLVSDTNWMTLSKSAVENRYPIHDSMAEKADRLLMVEPKIDDEYTDNPSLVKQELIRLTDLLIDDEADVDDIALYILLSYAQKGFNPVKLGRATKSSLHVRHPPGARVGYLYFSLDKIEDSELQRIAMFIFRGVMWSIVPSSYPSENWDSSASHADIVVYPKPVKDTGEYTGRRWYQPFY